MGSLRLAVLGDPIEHSRSPAIHRAAMAEVGLEGTYEARRANPADLADAVAELRDGSLHGFNVTMPLKSEAARLSDILTEEARAGGSVNTMRMRDGLVEGHSSDVVAAALAFSDDRFDGSAPILILGAGGAAAAAMIGATGRHIYLSARNHQRAAALAERIGVQAAVVPFGTGVSGALLVNATPLGMSGEVLPETVTHAASGVIDLAYGDEETRTISEARARSLPLMDGVEFLVLQAAASFEWWTAHPAPLEVMRRAATKP